MGVNARKLLLAGGTGLVGGLVLKFLLHDARFDGRVFAPARRPIGEGDPRLATLETDFSSAGCDAALAESIRGQSGAPLDAFVCCLGTTIKAAGSREAFIAVDRDLVLRMAQLAFDLGARRAILVSSAGASRQSGNFYLRVKGEVEDALEQIGFQRLDIVQPGLLLGDRSQRRPAEALGQWFAPLAALALPGKLRRYRPVRADWVARAIIRLLSANEPGIFTHRFDEIRDLAG